MLSIQSFSKRIAQGVTLPDVLGRIVADYVTPMPCFRLEAWADSWLREDVQNMPLFLPRTKSVRIEFRCGHLLDLRTTGFRLTLYGDFVLCRDLTKGFLQHFVNTYFAGICEDGEIITPRFYGLSSTNGALCYGFPCHSCRKCSPPPDSESESEEDEET